MDNLLKAIEKIVSDQTWSDFLHINGELATLQRRVTTLEIQSKLDPQPEPATGGLVEAVREAWDDTMWQSNDYKAHVAIEAVAEWLAQPVHGCTTAARILRRELEK